MEPTGFLLVLSENGRFKAEVRLGRERLSIGRRPYNDLVLDDLTVSGKHALIQMRPEGCLIRDLDSRNGTHVNGRPIAECQLAEGDCIDIGIYRLRLAPTGEAAGSEAGQAPGHAAGLAAGVFGGPATGQAALHPAVESTGQQAVLAEREAEPMPVPRGVSAVEAPPAIEAAPSDMPVLEYLSGPYEGITQRVDRNIMRIGNGASHAAVLARRRPGWFVTHLEGMAMPMVNGVAIGLAASPLDDGDLIELAGAKIRFRLRG